MHLISVEQSSRDYDKVSLQFHLPSFIKEYILVNIDKVLYEARVRRTDHLENKTSK